VSRVDEQSRKVIATNQVGIPGAGGDIGYGGASVWPAVLAVPLTRIDASANKVVRQWVGKGGDSLRFGFDSLWLTDYRKDLLARFPASPLPISPSLATLRSQRALPCAAGGPGGGPGGGGYWFVTTEGSFETSYLLSPQRFDAALLLSLH
jgi:hypothetical protein